MSQIPDIGCNVNIGCDVRRCQCGGVLSFRDGCSFCLNCEKEVHEVACESNKKQ